MREDLGSCRGMIPFWRSASEETVCLIIEQAATEIENGIRPTNRPSFRRVLDHVWDVEACLFLSTGQAGLDARPFGGRKTFFYEIAVCLTQTEVMNNICVFYRFEGLIRKFADLLHDVLVDDVFKETETEDADW